MENKEYADKTILIVAEDSSFLYDLVSYLERAGFSKRNINATIDPDRAINIIKDPYLFIWGEISKKDTYQLEEYIASFSYLGLNWKREFNIEKNGEDKINIKINDNLLEMTLNRDEKKVILTSPPSNEVYEYPIKEEDGSTKVYINPDGYDILLCGTSFAGDSSKGVEVGKAYKEKCPKGKLISMLERDTLCWGDLSDVWCYKPISYCDEDIKLFFEQSIGRLQFY